MIETTAWGSMEWLVDETSEPGCGLSVARMTLDPGRASEPHLHGNCNEVMQVLSGAIELRLGGALRDMAEGAVAFVPAGTAHAVRNRGPEPALLLLCFSSGKRDYRPVAGV